MSSIETVLPGQIQLMQDCISETIGLPEALTDYTSERAANLRAKVKAKSES